MDFDAWKAEREWIDELKGRTRSRFRLMAEQIYQDAITEQKYPITMANIITKDKATRESVDRHMRNSIEYENPNLKDKAKADFPAYDRDDKERLRNQTDLKGLLEITFKNIKPKVGGWRIDENYKGFFTYSPEGLIFDKNEIRVEFGSMIECINKLNQITNDYVPIGHI